MRIACEPEKMPQKKVFILQEIIPSYRVPIFCRLAQLDGVDLTVFYSRSSKAMIRENLKSASEISGFQAVELPLFEIFSRSYQFGILWQVICKRPDVMIAGNCENLDRILLQILCKIFGIRILWFQGGVPYIDEQKIYEYTNRGKLNRWLGKYNPIRWLARKADGLIVYSEHARRYFTSLGYDAHTIWVAPNSPDTEALEAYQKAWQLRQNELDAERTRFSPQGEKIIFLLGRLNKDRKADILMRALQNLRQKGIETSLVIVGDGGERGYLENLARELGLSNVFFEGAIYDEMALSKYFMVSDIFVTPGVSSLAVKMAMSFGKPVITVDYGLEVHDVENGINGYVFPMDHIEALTEKLQSLLQSEKLMRCLGEGGIQTIKEKINIDRMIEGFRQAIFDECGDQNAYMDALNRQRE